MRRRFLGVVLLLGLVLGLAPVQAKISFIDPQKAPDVTLETSEAQKLAALQQVAFPNLESPVSPDDQSILASVSSRDEFGVAFVNVNDGAATPVDQAALDLGPLTEIAWRDNRTAVYIGDDRGDTVLVSLDRETGGVVTRTLDLPGFPVSLAPNASRVVLAVDTSMQAQSRKGRPQSPFTAPLQRSPFERAGPAKFDAGRPVVKLSTNAVTFVSLDLNSGQTTELVTVPEGSGIVNGAWSKDGAKLAFVRITIPRSSRSGTILSTAETKDGLGLLAPKDNPFFQNNFVDTFDFARQNYRLGGLKAADGDSYTYGRVGWSTDGKILMTQVQRPSKLIGRRYPIYQQPDRSALRFYDADLKLLDTLDRPEIDAPFTAMPYFVSPDEVMIDAPVGATYRLFYYNRVSGEFRQLESYEGTYYQLRSTNLSRQLLVVFSSFQQPYEILRIGWDGGIQALTAVNGDVAAVNQVRADPVTFTLRSGARRAGYIVQPADAPFPPRNTRMIVWQEGGPGLTMTNQWGSNVESPFNLLPNFGMALLVMPLPGREGFGPKFYSDLANGRNFGAIDIDEAAEIVDQMIARGYTTRSQVGITGCSYGGYFTSQSITRHPTTYAAANSQCTLLDLYNEWQLGYTGVLSYLEGRAPTADPAEYTRDSPAYNAVRVRTPLLLFDGTRDFLPYSIAENFHDQIAAGGWPVDLMVWQGEGHGLSQPNSQLGAAQAQINWFRKYLAAPSGE